MKKVIAVVLTVAMTLGMAMTTMAAASPSASAVKVSVEEAKAAALAEAAAKDNMSVQEYRNNMIESTPGVENAIPMGVPQGAIINGVKTNYPIRISKVSKEVALEAAQLGKVLNVINIKNKPAGTVQITIYSSKIAAGQKVSVYQKVDGIWTKLVSSVRAEHVDVVLAGNGPLAIIAE